MAALVAAAEQTTPVPASSLPGHGIIGNFYSAQLGPLYPPAPGDFLGFDVWPLGDGLYILNDTNYDYSAQWDQGGAGLSLGFSMGSSMMASSLASTYAYASPVYLTNMAASLPTNGSGPVIASFSIAGGTNFVPYDILTTTNVTNSISNWTWLGIGYTSNSYSFFNQPFDQSYYILAKPHKTMVAAWGADTYGQCNVPAGLTNVLAVSGGYYDSLALTADGKVTFWGGWGSTNIWGPTVPPNLTGVQAISAGGVFSLALLTNGTVTAWGDNVGDFGWNLTNVPAGLSNVTVISAGLLHSLALRSNGTVVAWGYNSAGETNVPVGLSNVVAISAGYQHSLAVSNGFVVAWGGNAYHQCNVPAGLSNVVDVEAGAFHSLALLNNGTVVAWGGINVGETNVPAGLTNVVAIAAGGDYNYYTAFSLALTRDGRVVVWGDDDAVDVVQGMTNVIAIAAGANHALALRTGPPTLLITQQPSDQFVVPGGNATFTARGAGLYGVNYQWQSNSVNLAGATNAALTVSNVLSAPTGGYDVVVTDIGGMGSLVSSNAGLIFVTPPVITALTLPTNQVGIYQSNLVLSVSASAPGQFNGFPISYQWQRNGTNLSGATSSSYTLHVGASSFGTYSVLVSNAAGGTNAAWQVTVYDPSGLVITQQPTNQYQIAGGIINFYGSGVSSNAVAYQWAFNGTNISGATSTSLTLTNVQAAQQGNYNFALSDGFGSVTSSTASFTLVTPPVITGSSQPTNQYAYSPGSLTLGVTAAASGMTNGFPLHYQWKFNGTNLSGATGTQYTHAVYAASSGLYSVTITNAAGSTNATWQVTVLMLGGVGAWGDDDYSQSDVPQLTNAAAISAGDDHGLALLDNGTVVAWGGDLLGESDVPADLSNVVAVAAGSYYSLALKADGTVAAWGADWDDELDAVDGLTNIIAIATGNGSSLALQKGGTLLSWGSNAYGQTNYPDGLTNITAISVGGLFSLALRADGTVAAWGDDIEHETDVPYDLTNVVAISAGFAHAMALKADGHVVEWGYGGWGQTNQPAGLSNVMAIAAGYVDSVALKDDGTLVAWGGDYLGEDDFPSNLPPVKLISVPVGADHYHTDAALYSPLVQYPVDVTKDLLLIYNTNSTDSLTVLNYYLANRPGVSNANVLGIGCLTNEIITSTNFTNQILTPYLTWLNQNPTKRPQYLLLFMDIPSRVEDTAAYPSVQYQLSTGTPSIHTLVTSINMNGLNGHNDCIAYINKLASNGVLVSINSPLLSASAGRYANTNYLVDDVNNLVCGDPWVPPTTNGLIEAGISISAIQYLTGCETGGSLPHLTNGINMAGYISWGFHSSLGSYYATNSAIRWSGRIIRTEESYNGQRAGDGGNFLMWFSSNAFGGTGYSNTPIGGPTYVNEPFANATDNQMLFYFWASGKNLAICSWNSKNPTTPPYLQVVGDPFVIR